MGRKARHLANKEIIKVLAERYPESFFVIPYKVVPLVHDIVHELFADLGHIPKEYKNSLRRALYQYKSSDSYLQSVAFGEYRRNLAGNRIVRTSVSEREEARAQLKERGIWTRRMELLFKVNMGRKEASNR